MKNKFIKSPAELQKHVDYIIELSNITDYSENGTIKEEVHLNVDLVLSEPLSALKRNKMSRDFEARHPAHKTQEFSSHYHDHAPTMPRRENLIAHGHYTPNIRKVTFASIIYSLFKPLSYSSK